MSECVAVDAPHLLGLDRFRLWLQPFTGVAVVAVLHCSALVDVGAYDCRGGSSRRNRGMFPKRSVRCLWLLIKSTTQT